MLGTRRTTLATFSSLSMAGQRSAAVQQGESPTACSPPPPSSTQRGASLPQEDPTRLGLSEGAQGRKSGGEAAPQGAVQGGQVQGKGISRRGGSACPTWGLRGGKGGVWRGIQGSGESQTCGRGGHNAARPGLIGGRDGGGQRRAFCGGGSAMG